MLNNGIHFFFLLLFIFYTFFQGPIDEASNSEPGAKPIHWASVQGHIAVVDTLIQAGVSINTADRNGCTPLIVACQYGHTALAGYLIGKGARLQVTDDDGDTALHWAAFKGERSRMEWVKFCCSLFCVGSV